MKKALNTFLAAILALGSTGLAFAASTDEASQQSAPNASARLEQRLSGEVRHELNMIPQFTVFDNLAYRVDGGTVTSVRPGAGRNCERFCRSPRKAPGRRGARG